MLRRAECAKNMEQRSNDAAAKDVLIKFKTEECASNMEQRSNTNYVVVKGARIKFRRGEYAEDMEHTANPNDESTAFVPSCSINIFRL